MATSSRSSQALLVLMVAVVLVVVTGPAMVRADWCPRLGDSCGPAWHCCQCDPDQGGLMLQCDWDFSVGRFVCASRWSGSRCWWDRQCGEDGVCRPFNSLEKTVREALGLPPGLPRKLGMKK